MKSFRLGSVIVIVAISIVALFSGLQSTRSALGSPDVLPAPHLGYGVNVWDRPQLAAGLGFNWIKLFEEAGPPPTTTLPYKVLYRIFVDGYPASLSTYLQHVHDLAQAGLGKVNAYEIGNETNLSGAGFWGGQSVNPEAYADLVCAVYPVIKSVDPQAQVVSAGLAPVGPWGSEYWSYVMDETVYAARMLARMKAVNNGQFCIDGFGYHPHGFAFAPETDYHSAPNGFAFRSAERMHDVMVSAGATNMSMWATEFGWIRHPESDPWTDDNGNVSSYSWCGSDPEMSGFLWMLVSEQQQADYVVRAFQYADENWPWMGPMFVWNLDFFYRGSPCTPQRFYSLFHATPGDPNLLSPTRAYTALAAMPKRLHNMPMLSPEPDQLLYITEAATPTVQTKTLSLSNLASNIALTWALTIDSAEFQPIVEGALTGTLTGTNSLTLNVTVDSSSITQTGVYTSYLLITAEPTETIGAPLTVPVTLVAIEQFHRVHLPLISKNYALPIEPVAPETSTLRFGLAFVSSAEDLAEEVRYQRAADIGGKLNRWPMYWPQIEKNPLSQPRVFDWSAQDANLIADLNHGFTVLPILMLTPVGLDTGGNQLIAPPSVGEGWKSLVASRSSDRPAQPSSQASPPQGLYLKIFNDNTDVPGPGKSINPNNRWAVFVNAAVNRYKPGGSLAQQQGWGTTRGVHYWEIWNEEDLDFFFSGTPTDYARLLKVAYLAAKQADPEAVIVFGGQAHFQKPDWLDNVLDVIATDPMSTTYHGFMDVVATHNYFWAWQTFGHLYTDRTRLARVGLSAVKSWITEIGVPICGEGSLPACDDPQNRWYRASPGEQADFLIQSSTYAAWLNTQAYVWFQLFDDCGNTCGVDAYGLLRNDNTARPAYQTYSLINGLLAQAQPYWRQRLPSWSDPRLEVIAFKQPDTSQRIVLLWNRYYTTTETAVISATAASAQLIFPDGTWQTIYPVSGTYAISLPQATNRNMLGTTGGVAPDGSAPIGGSPRILVESDPAVSP